MLITIIVFLVSLAYNCYRLLIEKAGRKSKVKPHNKSRGTREHSRNTSLSHGNTLGTLGSCGGGW